MEMQPPRPCTCAIPLSSPHLSSLSPRRPPPPPPQYIPPPPAPLHLSPPTRTSQAERNVRARIGNESKNIDPSTAMSTVVIWLNEWNYNSGVGDSDEMH